MTKAPDLILLHGNAGASRIERAVASARVSAALRQAPAAFSAGFGRVIIATDEPGQFEPLAANRWCVVDADPVASEFALHDRLASIIDRFESAAVAVMGAGGLPLLGAAELAAVVRALENDGAVTNNFFSADLTGWRPAQALGQLTGLVRDNQLPRRLRDDAGLQSAVLPRTTATIFDLDTPVDVAILAAFEEREPDGPFGRRLAERLHRVMPLLCDPKAEVTVAGRVGSQAWQYLERETACRVRMYSEERGLAAAGPSHRARSLLGTVLELLGPGAFFERMATLGEALFIDTRVIEAHMGLSLSREERFLSDCLAWEEIADPFLRDFTRAAADCEVPVIPGGHSLMAGGLMLLNDVAWRAHDRQRETGSTSR